MAIRKSMAKNTDTINYKVLENCGVVAPRKGGYTLELRYISWNDRGPVYDLRPWKVNDEGEEICGKGITLSGEELESLGNLIATLAKGGNE